MESAFKKKTTKYFLCTLISTSSKGILSLPISWLFHLIHRDSKSSVALPSLTRLLENRKASQADIRLTLGPKGHRVKMHLVPSHLYNPDIHGIYTNCAQMNALMRKYFWFYCLSLENQSPHFLLWSKFENRIKLRYSWNFEKWGYLGYCIRSCSIVTCGNNNPALRLLGTWK